MSDFSFPIPPNDEVIQTAADALDAQQTALNNVLHPLAATINERLLAQQRALATVQGRTTRTVNQTLHRQQAALANVLDAADTAITSQIAQNGVNLAAVQTAAAVNYNPFAPAPSGMVPPPTRMSPLPPVGVGLPPQFTNPTFPPVGANQPPAPAVTAPPTPPTGTGIRPLPPVGVGLPPPPPPPPVDAWRQWHNACTGGNLILPNGSTPNNLPASTYTDWLGSLFLATEGGWFSVNTANNPAFFDSSPIALDYAHKFYDRTPYTCPPPGGPTPPPTPIPPPPVPPPSQPPPSPVPTPPAPCPAVVPAGYYCTTSPNGDAVVIQVDASGTLTGDSAVAGPFDSYDTATSQCAPPADDIPVPNCLLPAGFENGLPVPGSPEWCKAQDAIKDWLVSVGNGVIAFLLGTDSTDPMNFSDIWPKGGLGSALFSPSTIFVRSLIVVLHKISDRAGTWVHDLIECWKQFAKLQGECSTTGLIGIAVLRAALQILRKCRIGLSWPCDVLVDMSLTLPQIERAVDYVFESMCPSVIPDAGTARTCYLQGQIDRDTYKCWASAHGVSVDVWEPVLIAQGHQVGANQIIEWARRNGLSTPDTDTLLLNRGWYRAEDREFVQYLYNRIPDLDSWLRWDRADVLDEEYIARYRLDAGFTEHFWPLAQKDVEAAGRSMTGARRSYSAQVLQPGPGELRQFLYRLRPDKADTTSPFTEADYARLLQAANYGPVAIEWYKQTAYRILTEGQLQTLLEWRIIDTDQWYSGMRDLGYDRVTVNILAVQSVQQQTRDRANVANGWTLPKVVLAVRQGLIDEQEGTGLLAGQGYSDGEVTTAVQVANAQYQGRIMDRSAQKVRILAQRMVMQAYQIGTLDAGTALGQLVATGMKREAAAVMLSATDSAAGLAVVKATITSMGKAYRRGEITLDEAALALSQAGLQDARIDQYKTEWLLQRAASRPLASTGQVVKWATDGLLPMSVARQRLTNLGWQNPDLQLLIADLQGKIRQAQARLADKQASALKKAAREAEAVRKAALRALEKHQPLAKLQRWYVESLITATDVRRRMRLYGYLDADIDLYLRDWDEQIAAKAAKAAKAKPVKK